MTSCSLAASSASLQVGDWRIQRQLLVPQAVVVAMHLGIQCGCLSALLPRSARLAGKDLARRHMDCVVRFLPLLVAAAWVLRILPEVVTPQTGRLDSASPTHAPHLLLQDSA